MQIEVRQVPFQVIEHLIKDFYRKTKQVEGIPNHSEAFGVYSNGDVLVGYYIVFGYATGELEINQGYLKPEFQFGSVPKLSLCLLEQRAKEAGFKRIILASSRSLRAYTKFISGLGYKPSRVIFSKEI